jgi:hypothetical protein
MSSKTIKRNLHARQQIVAQHATSPLVLFALEACLHGAPSGAVRRLEVLQRRWRRQPRPSGRLRWRCVISLRLHLSQCSLSKRTHNAGMLIRFLVAACIRHSHLEAEGRRGEVWWVSAFHRPTPTTKARRRLVRSRAHLRCPSGGLLRCTFRLPQLHRTVLRLLLVPHLRVDVQQVTQALHVLGASFVNLLILGQRRRVCACARGERKGEKICSFGGGSMQVRSQPPSHPSSLCP